MAHEALQAPNKVQPPERPPFQPRKQWDENAGNAFIWRTQDSITSFCVYVRSQKAFHRYRCHAQSEIPFFACLRHVPLSAASFPRAKRYGAVTMCSNVQQVGDAIFLQCEPETMKNKWKRNCQNSLHVTLLCWLKFVLNTTTRQPGINSLTQPEFSNDSAHGLKLFKLCRTSVSGPSLLLSNEPLGTTWALPCTSLYFPVWPFSQQLFSASLQPWPWSLHCGRRSWHKRRLLSLCKLLEPWRPLSTAHNVGVWPMERGRNRFNKCVTKVFLTTCVKQATAPARPQQGESV